jgi:L-threonylcarbamoyladenylate synthase
MEISDAAARLHKGEVICFPTDTLYGIGGNALDTRIIKKIYALKGRPDGKGIPILASDMLMIQRLVSDFPEQAQILAKRFWPGPLTLVLPKHASVPEAATPGDGTVAVRIPGREITRELIALCGYPLAAPSANPSGAAPAISAMQAKEFFPDLFVLDGGLAPSVVPSTIVSVIGEPRILREGAISAHEIMNALNK